MLVSIYEYQKTSKIVIDATMQFPGEGGQEEFPKTNRALLEEGEPDIWTATDLQEANENTPKLPKLLRQVEHIAEEKHGGHLTLMRVNTGWKAMYGNPDYDSEAGRKEIQKLKTFKTLYEAVHSLL